MYPIALKRGEQPMTFRNRRDMVFWLLDNFTSRIVLIVGPMYQLDATIVGGVVIDLLDDTEYVQCWAVTVAGYHKIEYRDADGYMVAEVGQPKDDYYPGGRDVARPQRKKGKGARAKAGSTRGVQESPDHKGAGPSKPAGQPVGEALDRPQFYEHYPSWRDRSPVRPKTPGTR